MLVVGKAVFDTNVSFELYCPALYSVFEENVLLRIRFI
jgi:hypothetical protein